MAENEVVRTIRVRGVPEGLENLTSQLQRAEQAYAGVGTAAAASGAATETSARKLNTTERSYRTLTERLDSTARLYRQLQIDTRTLSGAFDAGFMGKGAEAASRFNAQLHQIQQTLQDVGGARATGNVGLDAAFGIGRPSVSARDAAVVFEAEMQRLDAIAQQRGSQIGADFGRELSERLVSSSGKAARDSASVFEAELSRLDDIARQKASQAGQEFQRALNERLVRTPGKSASGSASVFQEMFAAEEEQARGLQKLRQQYDPLSVAQERYAAAIDETNKLLSVGRISQEQHLTITANARKVLDDTTKAYAGAFTAQNKYGTGAGLARHELINLSRQIQDVGVSLASGQSPLTVLIQQGTQIADVFAASRASIGGFFAQAARGIAGFAMSGAGALTGGALLGAGAAAAAYKYAESQRAVEIALMGVGRASGQSVAGINRVAEAAAETGKISVVAARDIATIFAGTGRIDGGLISSNLIDAATRGYGNLTGKSQREAAQELAQALASPTAGAAELQKRLGSLSDAQMQFIRSAETSGNRTAAQKALFDAYNPTLQEAANKTNLLAKAWEAVAKGASSAANAVGKAITGGDLDQRIAELRKIIENRSQYGYRSGSIPQLQGDLDVLLRERRRSNEARDFRAADARSNELSGQAGDVLRSLFGDAARLKSLEDQAKLLDEISKNAAAIAKLDPSIAGKLSEGIGRLNSSIANFETTSQRIAKDSELQIAQINAYTLAEKVAVEAERARIEAIRSGRGELQAGVEAEQARSRAVADANRQLRDTMRDLRDAGSLIGLSPFQRQLQEARNQSRRETDTLGGGAGAGARGLETSFGENLRRFMAAVPGLSVTSGFRTYEEQARLYAQKPGWAARPGTSNHERGMAADLAYNGSGQLPAWVRARGSEFGIHFPLENRAKRPEPWHAEPLGGRRGAKDNLGATTAATTAAAREANVLREAYEGWNTPLANAERQLAANNEALARQKQTMFQSTEEVARASEKQRLINEYMQQGVPITAELAAKIEDYGNRFGVAARQAEELQRAQEAMKTIGDLGRSVLSGLYSDFRNGASGAEMLTNALDRVASKLMDIALNEMFGKALGGTGQGLFGGGGLLSSILSLGGGGLGLTPGAGGLYANGGYTGAGGKYDPAGVVHRGEYVFSAASVGRIGLGRLDRLHKGYAEGGYVTQAAIPQPYIHQPANQNAPAPKQKPGLVYSPTYNVASGANAAEVRAMLAQHDREMPAKLADMQKRFGT